MAVDPQSSVIITGAGRGIGRSIAKVYAERTQHNLLLTSRTESELKETREICLKAGAENVDYIAGDLTDDDFIQELIKHPLALNCSVLINNAGYFLQKSVLDSDIIDYVKQYEINTLTAIGLTNAVLPKLKTRESRIFTICSVTSVKGQARAGAYSAAKHGLLGYMQSLREALKDTKISTTAFNLGQTWSTSWDGSGIDPERLIDPEDIGLMMVSLCGMSSRTCVEEVIIQPQQGEL